MKLRSLVLALIAVISASAMATPCDEQITFTTSVRPTTNTVSVNDLKSSYTGVSEVATNNAIESFKLAWSFYYSNSRNGRSAKDILEALNARNDIKINSVGMRNHTAATSAAKMIESSDNLNKVKACEESKACASVMDGLAQTKNTINAATAPADLNGITVPACPATACPNCAALNQEVTELLNHKRLELGGVIEDGNLEAWERAFDAIPYTASPIKDGVDTLGQLKDIKSNFRQQKNIAKVSELEAKVRDKFPKPCFNAKFESTQQPKDNALNGLKELKQTYTIQEIETILNNADYYNYINVSTSGGRVVEDHVSICALVWMISAYNKNVGDSHEKREALASLLISKFGEKPNGQEILTNLNKFSVPTTVAKLSESTQKISITKIDSKLIEDQIKKHLTGYRTPVTQQTSSEFSAWLDATFPAGTDVDNEKFMELISKLLSLSSYSNDDVDVVVEKIFAKFGSTSNDIETVRTAIINAKNNKTSVNVKALINSLIRNTNIDKATIGGDDGINYIADEVSGTQTAVNGNPPSIPSGGNPSINPSSSSQSPDVNGDGKFSSTEVSDFVEAVTQVSADNVEDLVSMLLSLENYDEATLDAIVDSILNTFGAKGDPETNKTAIVNAIIKAKNSKSKADIQALVQALIDNTNIDVADLGGASAASTIANNIVASPVVKQKSYSLDEVKGRVDGTGTVTPKQKSYNFQEIMDAVDGK